MGLVVLHANFKIIKTKQKLDNKILWYEWSKKDANGNIISEGKMHELHGGKLNIKNNKPTVEDIQITKYQSGTDFKPIENWYRSNKDEFDLEKINNNTFSFNDIFKIDLLKSLEDNGISFDII